MIITIKKNSKIDEINKLKDYIKQNKCSITDASSSEKKLFGIIGDTHNIDENIIYSFNCVDEIIKVSYNYNQRKSHHLDSMNILIVGLGLIGGSYALSLSNSGYHVRAIDINEDSIKYGHEQGFINNEGLNEIELISSSDFIICSLYPKDTIDWIINHQKHFKNNVIITDTSGVKISVVSEIKNNLKVGEFIASHPMAGRETCGVKNANTNLFNGANFIITPSDNSSYAIEILEELACILNFKNIEIISPEQHDDLIGFLSQLTHAVAVSLMNSQETEHLIRYTGDSFRDLTRIAKINEKLWSELFLLNKDILVQKIDLFIDSLLKLRDCVKNEDDVKLKELFSSSKESRQKFDN